MSDMCKCGHGSEAHVGVDGCYSHGCLCTFFETNKAVHDLYGENNRLRMSAKILKDIDANKSVVISALRAENELLARQKDSFCELCDTLKAENARLKALVDEISVLITQFKKARNITRSIEAIAKIVVWNVEQEDRIGKEKRELLEATD